jgi:hypothetical protein
MGIEDKLCRIPFPTVKHGEDGGSKAAGGHRSGKPRATIGAILAAAGLGVYQLWRGNGRDSLWEAKLAVDLRDN